MIPEIVLMVDTLYLVGTSGSMSISGIDLLEVPDIRPIC